MVASKQPERYCECLNYIPTDPTLYNSDICAVCSQNKGPVDPPEHLVISIKTIKGLLKEGVFQDRSKAKLKFPHLFPNTTAPEEEVKDSANQENVGHDMSVKQAPGRTKTDWDEWLSVGRLPPEEDKGKVMIEEYSTSVARMSKSHTAEDEPLFTRPGISASSGSPQSDQCASEELQLPFKGQHRLMAYLQRYLKGVCYEFAVAGLATVSAIALCYFAPAGLGLTIMGESAVKWVGLHKALSVTGAVAGTGATGIFGLQANTHSKQRNLMEQVRANHFDFLKNKEIIVALLILRLFGGPFGSIPRQILLEMSIQEELISVEKYQQALFKTAFEDLSHSYQDCMADAALL
ncbi:hypothetical protein FPCIR_14136 [Fusarium pseudocircinatum]|uniref:Uncharacterized protein n=1 Tax=Fusarium pseudocircinatum TaxID=56676 RepID=A0A8H5KIB3_9HYPO|nr:hypothetical protein FPCIR_14136 [Fusarium pseudocircinatum]